MRFKQNHRNKSICFSLAAHTAGLILMLLLCLGALCGCGDTDKYVEIIVAGSDVVVTPVPRDNMVSDSIADMPSPTHGETASEEAAKSDKTKAESDTTTAPIASTDIIPTLLPTASPTSTPVITPVPTPVNTPAPLPSPTAVPAPAPTMVSDPDTEELMRQELDDVYAEYVEEWEKLYKEYEEKCALVLQSLDYMYMEPQPDDPEYIAEVERLNALLNLYEAEFKEKAEALDAVYYEKYVGIYEKYGR